MTEDRGELEKLFLANRDRHWIFIKPGGNQGDEMIYAGANKLAEKTKLDYIEIKMPRKSNPEFKTRKHDIIYIHGGGGFNTWWHWTPRLLNKVYQEHPNTPVVVGPTTVALQRWYLNKWLPRSNNILFFAREAVTHDYIKKYYYPNVKVDHDTAMHLKRGDKYLGAILGNVKIKEKHRLAAIREDAESPDVLPESLDLREYDIVTDPCFSKDWARLHAEASEIVTNRSHSAILGGILGKPTKIFGGSYHKNRSMYEYSMRQLGVKWLS